MEQQKSDAYAIISLAFALLSALDLFSFFRFASEVSVVSFGFFSMPAVAIIFGIIGLKSSARKVSIAGIAISVIDLIVKSTFSFVLPIVGIMLKGPG